MKKLTTYHLPLTTDSSQSGVTLIVAVVMLAAVSLASFTLSSIILRDIKSATLIKNSTTAIAGAYSGSEVGLYRLQRNLGGVSMTNQTLSESGASFDVIADLTDDPLPVSAITTAGDTVINLYNVENVDATDTGIRSITVTNTGTRPLRVNVLSWADASNIICPWPSIPSGQSRTCSGLTGPDFRFQLLLQVNGTGTGTASIQAFTAGGVPVGLPSTSPMFDATGRLGQTNHRIRIRLTD